MRGGPGKRKSGLSAAVATLHLTRVRAKESRRFKEAHG